MAASTYDPELVVITFGSITATMFGPDTFCKVSRDEDTFTKQVGSDGKVVRSRNRNRSGTIEITLQALSPTNDLLSAMHKLDEESGTGVAPFQVKDLNTTTLCSAQNAWVKKPPDMERAKETGVCVWVLDADVINFFVGGEVQA